MKKLWILLLGLFLYPVFSVQAATPVSSPYGADSLLTGVVLKTVQNGTPAPELTDRDKDTFKLADWGNRVNHYEYTFPDPVGIERVWSIGSKGNYFYVKFIFVDGTSSSIVIAPGGTGVIENEKVLNLNKPVTSFVVYGGGGGSNLHELDFSKVKDTIPPHKPDGLSAVAEYDQVTLKWNANTDKDIFGYHIYVDGKKESKMAKTPSYTVPLKDYTKLYKFYITAVDTSGNESVPSDEVVSTPIEPPDTTPPARPIGLKATPGVAEVKLTWDANTEPDLAGYFVYKDGHQLFDVPIVDTEFTVIGGMSFTDDTEFHIRAVDTSGNLSMISNVVKAKPLRPTDTIPPGDPTNLKAQVSADAVRIITQWDAVPDPDLDGYYIYVSKDGGSTWTRNNPPPIKHPYYEITPIQPDTEYQIKVLAVDWAGNESGFSNVVTLKTPSANTVITPKPQQDYLDVTWTPVPGAVSYWIYYNNRKVGEVPETQLSFRITKAMGYNPNSMTQIVDVRAQFSNGSSGGSNQPGKPPASGWGLTPKDILTNSVFLIVSLSSLVLFGLVIRIAPRLIKMLKQSIEMRRKST